MDMCKASGDEFVSTVLREQQALTAVDQFVRTHPTTQKSGREQYYRDLIPIGLPGTGEQFAFEVDLDACSGCKACVVACHRLNGLEEQETWRHVGLLTGGLHELPVVQHVTAACHHCVEPACAHGCPVEAYVKDDVTGIVHHLDDQCIGCQYCILKCPYEVPIYSKAKGIVRKCDMCHQRLAVGESPACVQSCPNGAIRIRVVNQQQIRDKSEAHPFLPGAPSPSLTLPSTEYRSNRVLPRDTLPADYFSVRRAHSHLSLVVMLILTQMSVGAFAVEQFVIHPQNRLFHSQLGSAVRPWHLTAALALGMLGMIAAVFHLGRPWYAYRALLGLRTSWLSREILAFGIFAIAATVYVGIAWLEGTSWAMPDLAQRTAGAVAALTGIAAVMCSVMIYVDTKRPLWTLETTTLKFLLTGAVLGIPTALLISVLAASVTNEFTANDVMSEYGIFFCRTLLFVSTVKLVLDGTIFVHLKNPQFTAHKRSALLQSGELSMICLRRFFFGIVGGVVLPVLMYIETAFHGGDVHPMFLVIITSLILLFLFVGEFHERFLFFAASVAPKMPGAPGE